MGKTRQRTPEEIAAKPGRPSELTPEKRDRIIRAARGGATREAMAAAGPVGRSTLMAWLKKGREQKTGEYRDFLDAVEEAEAQDEINRLARLNAIARAGQPQQADNGVLVAAHPIAASIAAKVDMWVLERRRRRWQTRQKHTHAGDKKNPIAHEHAVFELDVGSPVTKRRQAAQDATEAKP